MKKRLARKFRYYPLLRLLVENARFRTAFLIAFAIVIVSLLSLPKMWRTSPRGFEPVVYASWLDLVQCSSLKRAAARSMAAGDYDRALLSWYLALGQNPSDLATVRGFLDSFVKVTRPEPRMSTSAFAQIEWLLRLGKTNSADLVLAARVFDKQKWYSLAESYLDPLRDQLQPEAEAIYLKSLFHTGQMTRFKEAMERAGGRVKDPAMEYYAQAYAMGWGNAEQSAQAKNFLASRMNDPNHGALAARVYLVASAARDNPLGYDEALSRLSVVNEAAVQDHARYWSLLAQQGKKDEARKLAESFTTSPENATELIQLANVYFALGETNTCLELLRKFAPAFPAEPGVWGYYAGFLQETKNWIELREVAYRMRQQKELFARLWAYSYYLEGLSNHRRELKDAATAAFDQAADLHFELPSLGFKVANDMLRLRYPRQSLRVLQKLEDRLAERPDFWELSFEAAYEARDELAVLKASEEAYKLKPRDVQILHRYAAALMLNRRDPQESIKLTLQMVSSYPQSFAANLNHGFALLLNQRVEEARQALEKMRGWPMSPMEANAFHLALFELYVTLRDWQKAEEYSRRVSDANLFPTQIKVLRELRSRLPEPVLSAG